MAPKEAPCQQTHRLQLFSGERLVYESTQHISGIPMGDLFKVEARMDVTNIGTPQQPKSQVPDPLPTPSQAPLLPSKSTCTRVQRPPPFQQDPCAVLL